MFITFLEREQGPARRVWQWNEGHEGRKCKALACLSVPIKSAQRRQNLGCTPTIKNAAVFWGVQAIRVKNVGTMRN